jgi:hypothetical protein
LISHVVTIGFRSAAPVPAKAIVMKMAESSPSPTIVEPMVRVQSHRPRVAPFMYAST